MEHIDEQLKKLTQIEPSKELHSSVMKHIRIIRIRPILFVLFFLFVEGFIFVASRIHIQLIDAEFYDIVQDFFADIQSNLPFIKIIFESLLALISPFLLASFALSLFGSIYIGRKILITSKFV